MMPADAAPTAVHSATRLPWPTPRPITSMVSGPGTACIARTTGRKANSVARVGIRSPSFSRVNGAEAAADVRPGKPAFDAVMMGRCHRLGMVERASGERDFVAGVVGEGQ